MNNSNVFRHALKRTFYDLTDAIKTSELKDPCSMLEKVNNFYDSFSRPRYDEVEKKVHSFIEAREMGYFYQTGVLVELIKNGSKEGVKEMLDFIYEKLDENYDIAKVEFAPITKAEAKLCTFLPKGYIQDFEIWKQRSGIKEPTRYTVPITKEGTIDDSDGEYAKTNKLMKEYHIANKIVETFLAKSYEKAVKDLYTVVNSRILSGIGKSPHFADNYLIRQIIDEATDKSKQKGANLEFQKAFVKIMMHAKSHNLNEYVDFLHKKAEEAYQFNKILYKFDPYKAVTKKK